MKKWEASKCIHAPLDIANFSARTQVVGIPESLYLWYSFGKHTLLGFIFWILKLLLLKISKAPWKIVFAEANKLYPQSEAKKTTKIQRRDHRERLILVIGTR